MKLISFKDLKKKYQIIAIICALGFLIGINFADKISLQADIFDGGTSTGTEVVDDTDQDDPIYTSESGALLTELNDANATNSSTEEDLPGEEADQEPTMNDSPVMIENTGTGSTIESSGTSTGDTSTNTDTLYTFDESDDEQNDDNGDLSAEEVEAAMAEEITGGNQIEVINNLEVDEQEKEQYIASQEKSENDIIDEKIDELNAKITQVIEEIDSQDTGIPESEFMVSGSTTEDYNRRAREEKYENLLDRYENQIKELEEQNKYLSKQIEEIKNEKLEMRNQEIKSPRPPLLMDPKANQEVSDTGSIANDKLDDSALLLLKDTDGDLLSDHIESQIGTNHKLIDSDGDGFGDLKEIQKGLNPRGEGKLFPDFDTLSKANKKIVIKAMHKGLVSSFAGEKLLPNDTIYRYEAIAIVISALYPEEIYASREAFNGIEIFDDISTGETELIRYISIANKHKILDGIIADSFSPYDTFTKAEFYKIVADGLDKKPTSTKKKWVDTQYDNWFTPYISTLSELNILTTPTSARLKPLDEITRLEAIKIAYAAMEKK